MKKLIFSLLFGKSRNLEKYKIGAKTPKVEKSDEI